MATNVMSEIQVQSGPAIWTPPSSVMDHLGKPLPPERDCLVAPPREIGPVKSAYSSLKREIEAKTAQTRVAIVALAAAAGVGAGVGIDYLTAIHSPIWPAVIAALAALIAWGVTGFKPLCNFVGAEGSA